MLVLTEIKRQPVVQRGNLTIDPQCYTVTLAGEEIDLYPKEFDVLFMLMKYPGWVRSPEQIQEAVWQEDTVGCERVIYNTICQLRRKLKNPDMIQTVIGRGYKFIGQGNPPEQYFNQTAPGDFLFLYHILSNDFQNIRPFRTHPELIQNLSRSRWFIMAENERNQQKQGTLVLLA